jgi:hypothetical protein
MATNATAPSFTLPHDPLSKITGKPNFAAVTELRKELFENACPFALPKADNTDISA